MLPDLSCKIHNDTHFATEYQNTCANQATTHIQKHILYSIDNAPNYGQVILKAGPYAGKIGLIEWSASWLAMLAR